ncbi:biopolymer transporter Tol [Kocuria sp. M4R2S49]|uniref:biopolymer transporter Tol n=1 Tax=Kocuria rhizosphaericola TaxID=3376284 RepID=UPI0037948FDA
MTRRDVEHTPDGRWIVVDGRRWRRQDPALPPEVAARLRSHLGRARAAVRTVRRHGTEEELRAVRDRVGLAKLGLGERGTPWWEQSSAEREARWTDALAQLDAQAPPEPDDAARSAGRSRHAAD